jgi:drug/metabolite transporter (DMT)-like permease
MAVPETESAGLAAAAATAVCWSFSAVFFSAAARRVGQYHVNQVRLVQACVLLAIACAALGLYAFVPLRQLVLLSLSGLVGLTLGDAAGFKSLQILGARRASLLGALVPGIVAVMMWPLLNESLSVVGVLGMIITVAGIMWVVLERGQPGEIHGSAALGVFLGVLGAVGQAAGQLFSTAGMGMAAPHGFMNEWAGVTAENVVSTHPMLGTLVRMVAGCALLLAFAAARRTLAQTAATLKDGRALAQTTGGAFFGPFIGVTLSLTAFKYANPAVASTVIATSPVLRVSMDTSVGDQLIEENCAVCSPLHEL